MRDFRDDAKFDDADASRWPLLPVGLALAAAWLVLGWPWISGHVTIPWDAKAHFQPQIQFLAHALSNGESPFWNPYVFSGHPQIADPQSMIFSPPFMLLALVNGAPSLRAADTTVLLAILAGAFALVLLFRDRGWHAAGALIAAVAFAFGASMAWRIQHWGQVLSLAYLPIVLLLLSRALERRSVWYGLAAGLVAGFLVLGRDQVALLSVYLLAGYVLWHLGRAERPLGEARSVLVPLGAGALGGVLVIAIPILLTLLLSVESNRPAIDLEGAGRGSLHPALLLTFVAPDMFGSSGEMAEYWGPPSFTWNDTGLYIAQNMGQLYIGAVPLILLLVAAFSGHLWAREIRFFTLAAILVTLYALGWYTPFFQLAHKFLPGVALYRRPADATFLIGFLSAVLAGYGAHRLFQAPVADVRRKSAMLAGLVVLAAFGYAIYLGLYFGKLMPAAKPLLVAAGLMLAGAAALRWAIWEHPIRPAAALVILTAFTVGDLRYSNGPGGATALPPEHYEILEPSSRNETVATLKKAVAATRSDTRRDRVELAGLGFHQPNASLTHALENTLGYNPVRLGLYTRAIGAEDHIVSTQDRKFTPLFPSYRSTLADLLGLRFIATGAPIETADKSLRPGDLPLVARTPDAYIYENPGALPRVLLVPDAAPADFEGMIRSAGFPPGFDPRRTVLLEGAATAASRPGGTARIRSYANTEIVVEADSPEGGYLILNDIWHPWWRAEVDGAAVPLLRANVLFRAVAVQKGPHRVRFVFQPVRGAIRQLAGRE